jgi:hypothetical protein
MAHFIGIRRGALVAACFLASCSGGGGSTPAMTSSTQSRQPIAASSAGTSIPVDAIAAGTTLSVGAGKATLSLHSASAPPGASLSASSTLAGSGAQLETANAAPQCPFVPSIYLYNFLPFPITLDYNDLKYFMHIFIETPCKVDGLNFNVALYQVQPSDNDTLTTIGDVTGKGDDVGNFVPRAGASYTFAAHSASKLFFAAGAPGSNAIPVLAQNGDSTLGSGLGSHGITSLGLSYPQGSGASSFSVNCSATNIPTNVPFPGTAKGACVFTTTGGAVTLGNTVSVTITNPDPDLAFSEWDGPTIFVPCTTDPTNPVCTYGHALTISSLASTTPVYHTLVYGNAKDINVCIPKTTALDCRPDGANASNGLSTVPQRGEYDVLVSDDPAYNYDNLSSSTTGFAGYSISTSGGCTIDLGADRNDDAPSLYADPDYRDTINPSTGKPFGSVTTAGPVYFPMSTQYGSVNVRSLSNLELDFIAVPNGLACRVTVQELSGLGRTSTQSFPIAI